MTSKKVFETTIDVANPIDFASEKERHTKRALEARYNGRCYMGVFVLKVDAILRIGEVVIKNSSGNGGGYLDVMFDAYVYATGADDILAGVEISFLHPLVVGMWQAPVPKSDIAAGAKALVTLVHADIGALATKQVLAVRVLEVMHKSISDYVCVSGKLLVCDTRADSFRLKGALTKADAEALAPLAEKVGHELQAREHAVGTSKKGAMWAYERLLYAYRAEGDSGEFDPAYQYDRHGPGHDHTIAGAIPWRGPAGRGLERGAVTVHLLDVVQRALAGESVSVAGVWCRSLSICRSAPVAAHSPHPLAAWDAPAEGNTLAVLSSFLTSTLNYLATVRVMADHLDGPSRAAHQSIWKTMRAAQLA
jgi:hypothetical protein